MDILCRKTIFNNLTLNMEFIEWVRQDFLYIFTSAKRCWQWKSECLKMWQLFIDYLYPIINNYRLWFSVWLPITYAWHLTLLMCSAFKQCLRLWYVSLHTFSCILYLLIRDIIVRLRPLIFSFLTHPYALPLVPSISIGLKIMLTRYKIHRR